MDYYPRTTIVGTSLAARDTTIIFFIDDANVYSIIYNYFFSLILHLHQKNRKTMQVLDQPIVSSAT